MSWYWLGMLILVIWPFLKSQKTKKTWELDYINLWCCFSSCNYDFYLFLEGCSKYISGSTNFEKDSMVFINYRSVSFLTDAQQEIPKKQEKFKKILKNTVLASLKAKTGWKRPKKTENKNYRSVSFLPDA